MLFQRKSEEKASVVEARRNFLKLSSCGAMTSTTLLSTMLNLKLTGAAMAAAEVPTTDYKALVCVFLNGAIDGFQVLTPFYDSTTTGNTKYNQYTASRTNLSLRRYANGVDDTAGFLAGGSADTTLYGALRSITDTASGRAYGVHPRFPKLRELYNQGKATFVANVGSLVEPMNKTQFQNNTRIKPLGLFSHSDLQRHWQTAVPTSRNQVKGWGGKMADLLTDPLASGLTNVYSAISTLGSNIWQNGNRIEPYAVSAQSANNIGGAVLLNGYAPNPSTEYTGLNAIRKAYSDLQNDFVNQTYTDLIELSIKNARVDARDAADQYQTAIQAVTLPTEISPGVPAEQFETNDLGAQLATVARTIMARNALGQNPGRQIFMVQIGGWDHHANLLQNQNTMIDGIDNGLKAFHDFLASQGLLNNVVTFTISDFGRTISSNGIGSDHAWGNNMFVMSGALNTGSGGAGTNRIWGTYPDITLGSASTLDTSTRGTYIPTTSTDSYHAEICRWFGIPNNQYLEAVLPNIRNFYASGASSNPMGFLNF